ncbi:hypothetical protein [Salibaculum griseiflavum]|uniref:Uncharacterized protein n=1 Tax=Salibaculum griseiflavum TaxID=1914409 RepID=A0A2V1PAC2_9RHOB|nr:hypothetical protein [Salibaculum griseiflavum]PWG18062.1 hypothetical protein DFK10_01995 [Salibaculum griseiflavum]
MSALSQHFGLTSQEHHDFLYEWLANTAFGNGLEHSIYSPAKDREALFQIRQAILELDRAKSALSGAASDTVMFDNPDLAHWLLKLSEERDSFLSAIQKATDEIEGSNAPKGRERMNLDSISLVDAARQLWEVKKGAPAPSGPDLNPASQFADFLTDLFEEFDVEGSARAAFKAWARLHRSDEFTDKPK